MAGIEDETFREATACDARFVKVAGGGGCGKTEVIVRRIAALVASGTDPHDVIAFCATPAAAQALRTRLAAAADDEQVRAALSDVRVCTAADYLLELLASPAAEEATGRVARVLCEFEEGILMEDMKACGVKPKRLREMLKFFYRVWTELGDEDEGFLQDDEERLVHETIKKHLVARRAMLRYEVSNIACRLMRDHPNVVDAWRRPYVFVDDFENLNKASQKAVEALSVRQLFVCGCANEEVPTLEPYPYPQGFSLFATEHDGAQRFVLDGAGRVPARIASMANSLVYQGKLDNACHIDKRGSVPGTIRFASFTHPNDEYFGVARYVKHRVMGGDEAVRVVRPRQIFIAVPNKLWGRAIAKVLRANNVKCDLLVNYHALTGDPRKRAKAAALEAYTALCLAADEDDPVAWRSWAGFGDWLTHSNHWCRLEDYASEQGMSISAALRACEEAQSAQKPRDDEVVVAELQAQAAEGVAVSSEQPFLGASVLAERWRSGRQFIDSARGTKGFALLAAIKHAVGAAELPAAFTNLVEPVEGFETASELLERVRGRLENTFSDEDAVRIGLPEMALGQRFDTVILAGAVDGFYPSVAVYDIACAEERADRIRAAQRRSWYSVMTKADREFVLTCFTRDEIATAEALGMNVHRVRSEAGKATAVLAPSPFVDDLGAAAPGFDSGL